MTRIIITGYPASGKTTLAKLIADKHNLNYYSINDLAHKANAVDDYDEENKCDIVDEFKLADYLKVFCTEQDNFIIDGHMAHVAPKDSIDQCLLTRCSTKILQERMKERGYSESKIADNLEAANFFTIEDEVQETGFRPIIIDTEKSVEESLKEIETTISSSFS